VSAGPSGRGPGRRVSESELQRIVRLGGTAIIAILVLLFIVLNTESVRVSFVFFSARVSLIWVILLSIAIGWIVGPLLWRAVRRNVLDG